MAAVNPRALVTTLYPACRRALEAAAGLCLSRTTFNVALTNGSAAIEHGLLQVRDGSDMDVARRLRPDDVNTARATGELTKVVDGLRTGNRRAAQLSPRILDLLREAWAIASLGRGGPR